MAKGKGSSFEREICRMLSLWWTYGKDEDVFWRTAGSGAMAKTRSKKNLNTFGQYGDIQATNPIGQDLINLCSIELKRGYSNRTFADLLDKSYNAAEQTTEKFIHQAHDDSKNALSPTWALITKRDRRENLIHIPLDFFKRLKSTGCQFNKIKNYTHLKMKDKYGDVYKIFICPLSDFLAVVKPSSIKKLSKTWKYRFDIPEKEIRNKEEKDQIFKCTNCDEHSVVCNGDKWQCCECGTVFMNDWRG